MSTTLVPAPPATPAIAFLGTGRMGQPMAASLARAGLRVQAWNRTASPAAALIPDGATVGGSPAAAALKDAELAAQAAHEAGAELTITNALLPRWRRAAAGDDLAAIYLTP
jgi:3-hydroxyisobutyrate dehydrogenase-like beta-hydroxyacid dehydrogenase